MATKISVYFSGRTQSIIGQLLPGIKVSTRINMIADRYGELIDRSRRKMLENFTQTELNMLSQVWHAEPKTKAITLIGSLSKALTEGQHSLLGSFEEASIMGCIAKTKKLSELEEMALIEWIEQERATNQKSSPKN